MRARLVVLLLLSMSISAVTILPEAASATTLYVGGAGPGNYTTIQGAIDAASPGDTVFVYSGTYYQNVVVNKTLSLTGEDKNTTRIDTSGGSAVTVSADWVNVTGFNITEGSVGIEVSYSMNCHIRDNIISDNEDYGIWLHNSSNTMILDNMLPGNGDVGMLIFGSVNTTIVSNEIFNGFLKPYGIDVTSSSGGIFANNTISDYDRNIWFTKSSNFTISGNVFSAELSRLGFYVGYSTNITILQNVMIENGFYLDGDLPEHWTTHTIDISNTANGRPIVYLKNEIGGTAQLNAGHVILANCSGMQVTNQHVSNSSVFVQLGFSSDNLMSNNTAHDNRMGVHLAYSDNNTIASNDISDNYFGIYVLRSENNSIFHNLFINNTMQAIDAESTSNSWDNGYPSGGNYWSDYSGVDEKSGPNQNEGGSDGIGDTPYDISGGASQDRYPFMNPVLEFNNPPTASFTVTPPEGNITTIFIVDASTSSDPEDPVTSLEFRWDCENDGTWDDFFMTFQCQYSTPGTYTIRLEVRDTGGRMDSTTRQVIVRAIGNQHPTCLIVHPISGAGISNVYVITGTANDTDGEVERVEVRIDDGPWIQANGTTTWIHEWDTTDVPEGGHTIYARSYDGEDYSDVATVSVVVVKTHVDSVSIIPCLLLVVIAVVMVVTAVLLILVRRRKSKQGEGESPESG